MRLARPTLETAATALLCVGVAAPVLALAVVLIAMTTYDGFNHARQYLSELGGATAAWPQIFNFGVLISGVLTGVGGVGFGLATLILARSPVSAVLVGVVFALAGAGLVISSLYPWPDPRHMAINLGLGIQLAPLLLLVAFRRRRDLPVLRRFLVAAFVIMAVLTVLTKHLVLPGTVNDFNVGYWERAYAIVLVGWVGVAAELLRRALKAGGERGLPTRV